MKCWRKFLNKKLIWCLRNGPYWEGLRAVVFPNNFVLEETKRNKSKKVNILFCDNKQVQRSRFWSVSEMCLNTWKTRLKRAHYLVLLLFYIFFNIFILVYSTRYTEHYLREERIIYSHSNKLNQSRIFCNIEFKVVVGMRRKLFFLLEMVYFTRNEEKFIFHFIHFENGRPCYSNQWYGPREYWVSNYFDPIEYRGSVIYYKNRCLVTNI